MTSHILVSPLLHTMRGRSGVLLLPLAACGSLDVPSSKLHARNRHVGGYDIQRLADGFPLLREYVLPGRGDRSLTIDFANPSAVEALNAALLTVDYGVRAFALPCGYLCPAVPGRADYLHVIADLLAADNVGSVPRGREIRGLDIGVGASCIYPLIGHAEYGWSFLASDIDDQSLVSAAAIAQANDAPVALRRQPNAERVLEGVLRPREEGAVAFTLCNPPFYASAEEEAAAAARKWKGLRRSAPGGPSTESVTSARSFGGRPLELWCPGGERLFVARHIRESARLRLGSLWFTSLVSSERSMRPLRAELARVQPRRVEELSVSTGNKAMRVLAWSFHDDAQRQQRLWEFSADAGGGDGDGGGAAAATAAEAMTAGGGRQQRQPQQGQRQTTQRQPTQPTRRRYLSHALAAATAGLSGLSQTSGRPLAASAILSADDVPRLGRFERLQGARAFIGAWQLACTDGPLGTLVLKGDGDVELRDRLSGRLLGTGIAPWSYAQPGKDGAAETAVRVRFSLDVSGSEWDVLYFSGAVDSDGGPERQLRGSLSTANRKVGDFVASPMQEEEGPLSARPRRPP